MPKLCPAHTCLNATPLADSSINNQLFKLRSLIDFFSVQHLITQKY